MSRRAGQLIRPNYVSSMWQHALNIVLGLGLAIITFLPTASMVINNAFGWTLVSIGILIAAIAFWGLIDEIHFESGQRVEHTQASNM